MRTRRVLLSLSVAVVLSVVLQSSVDAGGLFGRRGIFRSKSSRTRVYVPQTGSQRVYLVPQSRSVYSSGRSSSGRSSGQKQWPGAIGFPSYRYQIFEDVNGAWR